jgi:hypothetical protein
LRVSWEETELENLLKSGFSLGNFLLDRGGRYFGMRRGPAHAYTLGLCSFRKIHRAWSRSKKIGSSSSPVEAPVCLWKVSLRKDWGGIIRDLPKVARKPCPRHRGPQALCRGLLPYGEIAIGVQRGLPLEDEKQGLGSEELLPFKLKLAGMCFQGSWEIFRWTE